MKAARRSTWRTRLAPLPDALYGLAALALSCGCSLAFVKRAPPAAAPDAIGALFEHFWVHEDMHVDRGAVLRLGVIVAAVVMAITGWGWVDPVVGAGIAGLGCARELERAGVTVSLYIDGVLDKSQSTAGVTNLSSAATFSRPAATSLTFESSPALATLSTPLVPSTRVTTSKVPRPMASP